MSIQKSLKNAMLTGNGLISWKNNTPTQYNGRQRQYFSPETRTFTQMIAQYSSDFVEAQMQGIAPDNPYEYQTRMIRMADIVKPTAAIQRNFDDYKTILVADRDIEYIMPGSKIVTMGNTWLVVNPLNVSGSDGAAVVRRCNAVWNFLDFYGNVQSEPLVVENTRANANDSDNQQSLLISKGYFNVICQYNENTRQIDTNTRFILGTAAYRVTGYSDFEMEFTGDYSTVRTLSFTVRYEEPNSAIDDMVNHIAGGKTFSWDVTVTGPNAMRVGTSAQFIAKSVRNGSSTEIINISGKKLFAPPTWSVENDELICNGVKVSLSTLIAMGNLASYTWSSSDESILTVDDYGVVTAIAEGTAQITATLTQNPAFSQSVTVIVSASADGVAFTSSIPNSMGAFENIAISAAYFENGAESDELLKWTFADADSASYAYTISQDEKSVNITCYGYSKNPLVITAEYGSSSVSATIRLEGI